MREQAEQLGFTYNRRGCPCNGENYIYTIKRDCAVQQLTIWTKRNVWQLKSKGYLLAHGTSDNLQTKIKALWDL